MPDRQIVAKELAEIFKILAHPDRVRIIEELRSEEKDVNTLVGQLGLPGSRVSRHLGLMRAHRIVEERRNGRHQYYHVVLPEMADWIIDGLTFVEGRIGALSKSSIVKARQLWSVAPGRKAVS